MKPSNQPTGFPASCQRTETSLGFTLVELIFVIVIIGILAATALPKFMNLKQEARIAALNGMRSALASAASMTRLKCAVAKTCIATQQGSLTINGTTHFVWYGWPIESTRQDFWNIADLIDYSGFRYSSALVSGKFLAYFDQPDAPTPSACRVIYEYQEADIPPKLTILQGGC